MQVREDYVLLHHDEAAKRLHVLYAARISPAHPRILIGFPTQATPQIETLGAVDLPKLLHALITPNLIRETQRGPVAPVPWISTGATLSGFVVGPSTADVPFDADWTKSYVDKGFFIASLEVQTPADQRLEVLTPTGHISFESQKLVLQRREPPLPTFPTTDEEPAEDPDKPHAPFEVKVDKIEPSTLGLSTETIGAALSKAPGPLVACYETFLERRPGDAAKMSLEIVVRPKGEVATIRVAAQANDQAGKELEACVVAQLRKKPLSRADEGYKLAVQLSFTPPRTPSRRTHVITLGHSKYAWRNAPGGVRLSEDFEVAPEDVARALNVQTRKALGLQDGQRLWLSHWIDRETRRTMAEDVEFVRQDLPRAGEPGTLPVPEEKPATDVHGWKKSPTKNASRGHTSQRRRTAGALAGMALVIVLALWIARAEVRG